MSRTPNRDKPTFEQEVRRLVCEMRALGIIRITHDTTIEPEPEMIEVWRRQESAPDGRRRFEVKREGN